MMRQVMKVCRDCTENNLPECGKGGCARRDAWIAQSRAARVALQKEKDDLTTYLDTMKRGKAWRRR